jgi:hypothetical protein
VEKWCNHIIKIKDLWKSDTAMHLERNICGKVMQPPNWNKDLLKSGADAILKERLVEKVIQPCIWKNNLLKSNTFTQFK